MRLCCFKCANLVSWFSQKLPKLLPPDLIFYSYSVPNSISTEDFPSTPLGELTAIHRPFNVILWVLFLRGEKRRRKKWTGKERGRSGRKREGQKRRGRKAKGKEWEREASLPPLIHISGCVRHCRTMTIKFHLSVRTASPLPKLYPRYYGGDNIEFPVSVRRRVIKPDLSPAASINSPHSVMATPSSRRVVRSIT